MVREDKALLEGTGRPDPKSGGKRNAWKENEDEEKRKKDGCGNGFDYDMLVMSGGLWRGRKCGAGD